MGSRPIALAVVSFDTALFRPYRRFIAGGPWQPGKVVSKIAVPAIRPVSGIASGPCQGLLMFRRKQLSQLAKNFVAESECVIEFGEDAPDPLGSTAWVRLRCERCKVVPDRRDV